MIAPWHRHAFTAAMPHLAPGAKLSEVEFLKLLNAYQWEAIAHLLERPPREIVSEFNDRLYSSVHCCELNLAGRHSLESLGEDARIRVANRIRVYAKRFVEGLFVIDDQEIPGDVLDRVKSRADLEGLGLPWAYMTNVFVARAAGNTGLRVFKPVGIDQARGEELDSPPEGIPEHRRVQSTGEIEPLGGEGGSVSLRPRCDDPIRYQIVPESDLNGAGLIYFARYVAMMNYGERVFLAEHLERPLSTDFAACLSAEHRRIYYFANASPGDCVDVRIAADLIPPGAAAQDPAPPGYQRPLELVVRADLYRRSDGVLMASSRVRKALTVPADAKAVVYEAERLLHALR